MKLRALRVAEVGPFREPVALEGLSGGLDIFIGPNERGKSTLLAALRAVIDHAHNSNSAKLNPLKPYAGGDPLIELEVDHAGRRLLLRKRYRGRTKGSTAEVIDVAGSRVLAVGEAAEAEIATLFGARDGMPALLWLKQDDARTSAPLSGDAAKTLRDAISGEIEAAAGGEDARALLQRVDERLQPLMTKRGDRPPAGSPFAAALDEQHQLVGQIEQLRADVAALEDRRRLIAEKRAERARLQAGDHEAALVRASEAARTALRDAEKAKSGFDRARDGRHAADAMLQQARSAREHHAAEAAELARIESAMTTGEAELERFDERRRVIDEDLANSIRQRDENAGALARARTARDLAELAQLEQALAATIGLEQKISALDTELARAATSPETIARISALDREIALVDQRLAAAAATVAFDLVPAGRDRVRIGGRVVVPTSDMPVVAPTVIEIDGIGRITVSPGASVERARDAAAREEMASKLGQMLAAVGGGSLAEAETREASRVSLRGERETARAALAAHAPDGRRQIEARIARLSGARSQRLQSDVVSPAIDPAAEPAALEAELQQGQIEVAAIERRRTELDLEAAKVATSLSVARERREALTRAQPDPSAREERAAQLASAEQEAEARANAAIREYRAFEEIAPDAHRLAVLREAVVTAERAIADHARALSALNRELASHEGAVAALGAEGKESTLAELEGDLARVTASVARFERERAALLRLRAALSAAADGTRMRYLAPLQARLAPLLPMVLPDAQLALDESFAAKRLLRAGAEEPTEQLSGGTREQLAVLVRLAYARLLADSGRPAPLILDDPLVFADDGRLERMFAALASASAAHQIIVLTCHERAFAPLASQHGAPPLRLVDWRPAAA
jgi:energy-coupling factor transporter ATP-binding protein EcfA2